MLGSRDVLVRLARARRVMICGCGGDLDVYAGLPLYYHLKPRTQTLFLGSLSVASLPGECGRRRSAVLTEIDAGTAGLPESFPPQVLCRWFRRRAEEVSVFCFEPAGAELLGQAWQMLAEELHLEGVVLIDGGRDSSRRGDQSSLGARPAELANVAAVHSLDVSCKVLTCLGSGVDAFDGVCYTRFLESVAALQAGRGFLGAFFLLPEMPEAQFYVDAVDFSGQAMPVSSGPANATSMYWSFDLDAVAARLSELRAQMGSRTYAEVERAVERFRAR